MPVTIFDRRDCDFSRIYFFCQCEKSYRVVNEEQQQRNMLGCAYAYIEVVGGLLASSQF